MKGQNDYKDLGGRQLAEHNVFSDMEISYNASLLKKKIHSSDDVMPIEDIQLLFDKALKTLKLMMHELHLDKAYKTIAEEYSVEVLGRKSEQSSNDDDQ